MKIIINRSDAIGDTVLTMPMAKFIKSKIPGAQIVFIISPRCTDMFKDHPYVDEVWPMDLKRGSRSVRRYLKKKFKSFEPDAYFHVGGSHIPSYIAWLSRVKIRGGLKSKWQSFVFLNKAIRQHRSFVAMHESCYNIGLLQALDLEYDFKLRDDYVPQINISHDESSGNFDLFREDLKSSEKEIDKPLIFIHPGMTGHTLNWSSRNYARLVLKMEKNYPGKYSYIISHTPSDEKYLISLRDYFKSNVKDDLNNRIYFFDGSRRGLRHYMSVLQNAEFFIGPSTGTLHLANTLGVKHVGIYSPIKVQSSLRWGPFKRDEKLNRVIVPDVVCGELKQCSGETCPYYQCMDKVEVDDVLEAVRQLLVT